MLPVIIVGAMGALGIAGYKLARQCTICQERLKWTYSCLRCDDVICSGCANKIEPINRDGTQLRAGGFACPGSCTTTLKEHGEDLIAKHDAEQERLRKRLERIAKVRLVSVNFGGSQNPKHGYTLETRWFTEKSDAEESARQIAVDEYDVDTVWYTKMLSQKSQGLSPKGRTYFYREWKVVGEV